MEQLGAVVLVRRLLRSDDGKRAEALFPRQQAARDWEPQTKPLYDPVGSDPRKRAREDDVSTHRAGNCVPAAGRPAAGPSASLSADHALQIRRQGPDLSLSDS